MLISTFPGVWTNNLVSHYLKKKKKGCKVNIKINFKAPSEPNTEILTPITKRWAVKVSSVLFLNTWKSLDTVCTKYFPHANVSWHNRLGIQLMSISSRSKRYDLQHPLWPEMNPSWSLFTAFQPLPTEQSRVLLQRREKMPVLKTSRMPQYQDCVW